MENYTYDWKRILPLTRKAVNIAAFKIANGMFSKLDKEEIEGTVLKKICISIEHFDENKAPLEIWIGKIASNCVNDAIREKCRIRNTFRPLEVKNVNGDTFSIDETTRYKSSFIGDGADTEVEHDDILSYKKMMLSSLNDRDRRIFLLYEEGYKPCEIATMVEDTNANIVSISIYRTKAHLAKKFGPAIKGWDISKGSRNTQFSIGEEYHSDREIEDFIERMYYSSPKIIATAGQAA